MITKSTLALSALLVVSASASAFAYEAPENKIGDRYPFLEQTYRPVTSNVGARHMVSHTVSLAQYINEAPENRISDRYPALEQIVRVSAVKSTRSVKPLTLADKSLFDRQSTRAVF